MELEWREIKGYDGIYYVSNNGDVKTVKSRGRNVELILKKKVEYNNYIRYSLMKDNVRKIYMAHRLVAEAFIPNPENKKQVNHIDFDVSNNNVSNLEWATPKENVRHFIDSGRKITKRGIENKCFKLSIKQINKVKQAMKKHGRYYGRNEFAVLFNVSPETITKSVRCVE